VVIGSQCQVHSARTIYLIALTNTACILGTPRNSFLFETDLNVLIDFNVGAIIIMVQTLVLFWWHFDLFFFNIS
jgi:hypothetical protein